MSAPIALQKFDSAQTMRQVVLALLPGIGIAIGFLGWGVLFNIVLAALCAALCEALALFARKRPIKSTLRDGSVLITAALLGLALPPFAPWWLILCGATVAMLLAKHAYGGLGKNSFNPAMVGYIAVLLTFPAQLAHWPAIAQPLDGYTMATALDAFKQNRAFTVADWWHAHAQFGRWGGYGWEWINLAFLGGGLYLLQQKIIGWQIPAAMLLALGFSAAVFYDNGSSASGGSPLFHWLSGATMLGAFFIATDPVTAAKTNRGKLCYGALIGILVYTIRRWGHYADGIAFAVLLGNAVAPLLDKLTAHKFFAARTRDNSSETQQ